MFYGSRKIHAVKKTPGVVVVVVVARPWTKSSKRVAAGGALACGTEGLCSASGRRQGVGAIQAGPAASVTG